MLSEVTRLELRYQLRSPIFWITSFVFFALTFSLAISDTLRIGWGGYVHRNSPFTIALICMVMIVVSVFIVTSFISNNRGTDVLGEVPLERVENQAHICYQKGGMVMYLLKDQMGADAVNRTLQSLIHDYGFKKGPPYSTSRDLIQRLREQAEPEHQQLISDLFEHITLYDLKVTDGRVKRLADGRWSVAIDVEARKFYADEKGVETEAPLDGLIDVGVFTAEPGNKGFAEESVLLMKRHRVRSGQQTFTAVVDQEPKLVGLDPYNTYIDRNPNNDVRPLSME